MSQFANVFRIMIASPSDVYKERQAICDIIYKWNSNNSLQKNTVLLPLLWETDAPHGVSDDPQELIDKHLIENSDMVIGIFFSNLGRNDYTINELKKHIDAGKQAIIFFKKPPCPKNSDKAKQVTEVLVFKENIKDKLGKSALYKDYSSLNDFKSIAYSVIDKDVQVHLLSNTTLMCRFSDIVKPSTTLQERIKEAKKNVFISGVTLVATLSTSFDDCIKNNIKVRILMAHNDQDLIKRLTKLSYATPKELTKHIDTTIDHFRSIEKSPKMKIRAIDAVVPLRLVGIDIGEPYGKIYVQQYLYKTNPATNPNYICYNGEELYNIYYQQIKSLWHDSIKIDF